MSTEVIVRSDAPEADRDDPRKAMQALVQRGEMEVVTTPSGEILYIRQAVDD